MPQQHRIPASLADGLFSRQQALDQGLTSRQLRRSSYQRVTREIWRAPEPSGQPPQGQELDQLLGAWPSSLSGHVLSHATAALFWGFRLPERMQRVWPVHVTSSSGSRIRRPQVIGHRARGPLLAVEGPHGVRVTGPVRTFVDLATDLTPEELVVVGDGMVCTHQHGPLAGAAPLRTLAEVERELGMLRGAHGSPAARAALQRMAVGADSAPETRLRLMLEDWGVRGFRHDVLVPGPHPYPVLPDLAHEGFRIAVQYEGAHHDLAGQRRRDILRQRATEAAGWVEVRIVAEDLVGWEELGGRRMPRAVAQVKRVIVRHPAV